MRSSTSRRLVVVIVLLPLLFLPYPWLLPYTGVGGPTSVASGLDGDLRGDADGDAAQPRAARSVHLWYPAPEGDLFYNEVTVEESQRGSYFSVCGFQHGYFGIQEIRSKDEKVVIFSVWDANQGDDPNAVPEDRRVQVLHGGEDVRISRFGNEGTGGKSMFSYPWKTGETYRFLIRAEVDGKRTAYSAYFFLPEQKAWKHLATFQTITGGERLKGYYSFVEDFRRDGESARQVRRARYHDGWVRTAEGQWIALTRARFTADSTPTLNIDAAVKDGGFVLVTGGDTRNTTPLQSILELLPAGLQLPEGVK